MPKIILMLGPSTKLVGGVSSVISSIMALDLPGIRIKNVSTLSSKSTILKLYDFLFAILMTIYYLVFSKIDLVHVHIASYNSFNRKRVFISLIDLFSKKYVLHLHGGDFARFYKSQSKVRQEKIGKIFKNASSVICVSNYSKRQISNYLKVESLVINNFDSKMEPHFNRAQVNNRFLSNALFFLGDISKNKGFDDAVRIVYELRSKYPEMALVCAGSNKSNFLEETINNYCAHDFVKYIGFVDVETKSSYFNSSFALIAPSHIESFGMSNLEASSQGLPVFAYDVGGVSEVVKDRSNGFLAVDGDSASLIHHIENLKSDYKRYEKTSFLGVKRVSEKFSKDSMSLVYLRFYNKIIENV